MRDVDGHEEVVHIPTNRTNMQYWQPEAVLDPSNCSHQFSLVDVGKREVECSGCGYTTSFIVGVNYREESGIGYIKVKQGEYPVEYL